MELFIKDFNRLEKEQNMTDFYLNRVLPITNFTQMMTTFRSIAEDEEQLKKLQQVQKKFFQDLIPSDEDDSQSIVESKFDDENPLKKGSQKALSEGDEAGSRNPSFGSNLDKKDLDLYSPKYREIIQELKNMK